MVEFALSPYIRRAWDNQRPSLTWFIRDRQLWDYELLYIKKGTLKIIVEDQTYYGVPGDVFLFKPRQRHSIQSEGTVLVRQPHIHFDLIEEASSPKISVSFKTEDEMRPREKSWFRKDLLSSGPLALPNHMRLHHPAVFEQMLFDLIAEFQMKLPYYELNLKGQFLRLLTYLIREHHWSAVPQVQNNLPVLLNIQEYLSHQTDREVTLDELSSMFHLSKYYLARLFRDAFQMSPIKYHQTIRLEKAKQLIQYTDMPLQSISDSLGFASIQAFSRAFKNKEGTAPSHFRRHHG